MREQRHNLRRRRVLSAVLVSTVVAGTVAISALGSSGRATHLTTSSRQSASCVTVGDMNPFVTGASLLPYARTSSGEEIYVEQNVYERLVDQDSSANPVPKLAVKWMANPSATRWIFYLRKGVRFDDGHVLTSKDVVWSYKLMLNLKSNFPAVTTLSFLKPNDVTAVGKYAVEFRPTRPIAEMPLLLSFFEGVIVPYGKTDAWLSTHADGTGPYELKSWTAGSSEVAFTANPSYWKPGVPKSQCAKVEVIQDATARAAAIESGQIDVNAEVDLETVGALSQNPNVRILASPPVITLGIWMWADTPPFNNDNVREALKLVVDRDFMVKTTQLGYAFPADDDPIPISWPSAWEHTYPKQNIAQAKQLLASAGYNSSNPLKVTLYASDIQPGALSLATAYKDMAAQAGVDVTIDNVPLSSYWDTTWLKQPMGLTSWGVRAAAQAFPLYLTCNASFKESHFCNQQVDALVNKAEATLNASARIGLYKQAEKIVAQQGGEINILDFKNLAAERTACTGFTPPFPFYQEDLSKLQCK